MTKPKVTIKLLQSLGANCQGLADFKRVFPRGAVITKKNCLKAAEAHLGINWFASHILSATAREAYEKASATAGEAYDKTIAPFWEAYDKASATSWEAYEKAGATSWEAYEKARATNREVYEKARAPAWKVYDKTTAIAFFEIYKKELEKGTEGGTDA